MRFMTILMLYVIFFPACHATFSCDDPREEGFRTISEWEKKPRPKFIYMPSFGCNDVVGDILSVSSTTSYALPRV